MDIKKKYKRRNFIKNLFISLLSFSIPKTILGLDDPLEDEKWIIGDKYNPYDHYWGMGISVDKCIGCGNCVKSCKNENDVPREPFFFRTWVERYRIKENGETKTEIDSPNGAIDGFKDNDTDKELTRSFFVPKICNHCDNPPCVQVCPVGATFKSVRWGYSCRRKLLHWMQILHPSLPIWSQIFESNN